MIEPWRRATFLAFCLGATSCAQEVIAHQQTEAQAIGIMVLLAEEGMDAEKIRNAESRTLAFDVVVPRSDGKKAYAVLKRHNLPEDRKAGTLELFKEGGMIPTAQQERAKREAGLAGDIANNLRRVPGVVDVAAHVTIPEDNPLRDVNEAKPRPKASVLATYLPDAKNQPPMTVEQVQSFVQGALAELKGAEISVQLIPTERPAAAVDGKKAQGMSANACEKMQVIGIEVCAEHRTRLLNYLVGVFVVAALASGLAVIAILRAMRYRKDLTRLTAQVAQLKR